MSIGIALSARYLRFNPRTPIRLEGANRWSGTHAEIAPGDLIAEAIEHCVFPLAAARRRSTRRSHGLRSRRRSDAHRRRRPPIPRHDELAHPGQLARLRQCRDRRGRPRAARAAPLRRHGPNLRRPTIELAERSPSWRPEASHRSSSSAADRRRSRRRSRSPSNTSPGGGKPRAYKSSRAGTPTTARRWARWRDRLARHPAHRRSRACPATRSSPARSITAIRSGWRKRPTPHFCADYLEQQILHEGPDYVAAFIAEPVMQANGVQIPPTQLFRAGARDLRPLRRPLINDEVITGFGRTGTWFAIEHFGVEPDIMTMAKALTAGYVPMGAVIARPSHRRPARSSATSTPSAATPARPRRPTRSSRSRSATG